MTVDSPKHGLVNHGGYVVAEDNVTFAIQGSHVFAGERRRSLICGNRREPSQGCLALSRSAARASRTLANSRSNSIKRSDVVAMAG